LCYGTHQVYAVVTGEVHARNLGEPKFLNRHNNPHENTTTILDYTGFRSKEELEEAMHTFSIAQIGCFNFNLGSEFVEILCWDGYFSCQQVFPPKVKKGAPWDHLHKIGYIQAFQFEHG
jgi:hypothetical protein